MNYRFMVDARTVLVIGFIVTLGVLWPGLSRQKTYAQAPAQPAFDRVPLFTLGSPVSAVADGQGNVVVTYTSGVLAITRPNVAVGNLSMKIPNPWIRLYRPHTDGSVEELTPAR